MTFCLFVLAANDNQVAFAALGQLHFDRRHPDAAGVAFRSDGVQQDAGIPHVLGTVGSLAPFVINAEVIVLIGIDGGQIAHPFAGDVNRAVFDRVVFLVLIPISRSQPRRKAAKIFSVEWPDHFLAWLDRRR